MSGAEPGPSGKLRWPLRILIAATLVVGLGWWLFPAAKTALLVGYAAAAGWALFAYWDKTRGASFALDADRRRWMEVLGAVDDGPDLHVMEDKQPLIVRLARRGSRTAVAVLTPLPETTAAFRLWPHDMPKPGFDGNEPPVGGPLLTPLHALEASLGGAFAVEGNEPARIARWLDEELLKVLLVAQALHPGSLRGLTFDGRFLAVHWLEPADGARLDPAQTMAAASPVWRAFVPRLPTTAGSLMH